MKKSTSKSVKSTKTEEKVIKTATKATKTEDQAVKTVKATAKSAAKTLKTSTLAKFLPNAVTITAMCFGLTSMRFAYHNEWEYCVLCILVAAILDMFDGKIARLLDQSSSFGLELDSLSDLVCFGVAPSVALYLASMYMLGKVGCGICMFYTICCALRLARFNITHSCTDSAQDLHCKYYTGIPAPVGALLALFPLVLFFETENIMIISPIYVSFFLVFSGILMISTVKTFSSKIIEINQKKSWIALAIIAFVIVCLTTRLWLTLSLFITIYIILLPYGVYEYQKAVESQKH